MTAFHRKFVLELLFLARQSFLRRSILRCLVWAHNQSYHMISFFASYNGMHPKHRILNYHDFFVTNITPGDRVLDIGSGNGAVAFDVAKKARQVTGIDISKINVSQAQKKYPLPNLDFVIGDARTYRFENIFDVIILSNVLEHIDNRSEFLRKLSSIAPRVLIRVPMLTRDWITVYKKEQGFEYRLDNTHFTEYTEEQLEEELTRAGWKLTHVHNNFGELYAIAEHG